MIITSFVRVVYPTMSTFLTVHGFRKPCKEITKLIAHMHIIIAPLCWHNFGNNGVLEELIRNNGTYLPYVTLNDAKNT